MFDLEKRERLIILLLAATLLAGIFFRAYHNNSKITDIKIKGFAYESSGAAQARININEANEAAIALLDGIGPSLAERIVEYRYKNGRFASIEELKKVKGIGDKLFDKIKDEVSIE